MGKSKLFPCPSSPHTRCSRPRVWAYEHMITTSSNFLASTDEMGMRHRLQTALSTCDPADGVCAINWLSEDCLVLAEQLGPTNCPDAPCPPGDDTCELLDPSTCGDDCLG